MSDEGRPREWWIDPVELDAFPPNNFKFLGTREWQSTCIPVIERSAYDAVVRERDAALDSMSMNVKLLNEQIEAKRKAIFAEKDVEQQYLTVCRERDKWKDEYENLCKFATDYENQRDELRAEVNKALSIKEEMFAEIVKLRTEIELRRTELLEWQEFAAEKKRENERLKRELRGYESQIQYMRVRNDEDLNLMMSTSEERDAALAKLERAKDALSGLLADTQHAHHNCGDERCPVDYAREVLAEIELTRLANTNGSNADPIGETK